MALKKLPSAIASERFSQIVLVTNSDLSLYDKLTKDYERKKINATNSIRSILFGLVIDVMSNSEVYLQDAKSWELLNYVLDNAPSPLGETLDNDIRTVWSNLNSIKKNKPEFANSF